MNYRRVAEDVGASPKYLKNKYNEQGGHPDFPLWLWREDCALGRTLNSYWWWVVTQIEEFDNDMEADNPYTTASLPRA